MAAWVVLSIATMMHAKARTEGQPEEQEFHGPRTSGTRRVAVPFAEEPHSDVIEARLVGAEPERSDRPTLRVPRFELLEGGDPSGGGVYASVLGGAHLGAQACPDGGRDEVPTVPVPAYTDERRQDTQAKRSTTPPSRGPPSFRALGSLDRVPYLTCTAEEIRHASLDHRQAFVLVLVDGYLDIETILDATPLPLHDVLRILLELLALKLIALS